MGPKFEYQLNYKKFNEINITIDHKINIIIN